MDLFRYDLIIEEFIDMRGTTFYQFSIIDINEEDEVLYLSNKYLAYDVAVEQGNKILDQFTRGTFEFSTIDSLPF